MDFLFELTTIDWIVIALMATFDFFFSFRTGPVGDSARTATGITLMACYWTFFGFKVLMFMSLVGLIVCVTTGRYAKERKEYDEYKRRQEERETPAS